MPRRSLDTNTADDGHNVFRTCGDGTVIHEDAPTKAPHSTSGSTGSPRRSLHSFYMNDAPTDATVLASGSPGTDFAGAIRCRATILVFPRFQRVAGRATA